MNFVKRYSPPEALSVTEHERSNHMTIQTGAQISLEQLTALHQTLFAGPAPILHVRAPGRVNLIGEHTDYNDGFVLPIAMSRALHVVAAPNNEGTIVFRSTAFPETVEFPVDHPGQPVPPPVVWGSYVRGVAALLIASGVRLHAGQYLIHSEVPIGGGVSSSAALEIGCAAALLTLAGQSLESIPLALLGQQAEHQYAHSSCGIMDQFICVLGQSGHALLLDCRSHDHEQLPLPQGDYRLMVMDTQVKHNIGSSEYPVRQRQCREGLAVLQKAHPGAASLRDMTPSELADLETHMDPVTHRRCRHVVTEIARTLFAAEALRKSDVATFGRLMYESHASLRDDYEVSCAELDALVDLAQHVPGVYGARMTGGGFGGCVIALIETAAEEKMRLAVTDAYDGRFARPALIYATTASDGVSVHRL